ncbi:DUF4351 domain-containing protein [Anabaena azotica]|uniref:DUF4351 domain-containing protein n=1 Tax=Anabaena azotica FACHB-119 TaxID=947527 RepID=A0ABR8DDP3_9NOST|nr:DUF4351 domain-containing protein [Anabaena azotica]MBD2503843.1 DUF4351 domain-containing protein [Anabaena azotica FACHB-119]
MQESVIYQDILQKGEMRGEQRGQKIGEERTIIRQLNRRFGEIDSSLIDRIRILTVENLDDLAEALLDFSDVSDLVAWLNEQES